MTIFSDFRHKTSPFLKNSLQLLRKSVIMKSSNNNITKQPRF
uniref:Uncharacterized protein n=1 Tax=Siphoviridae sp. ct7EW56 TaxID=2827562 RepID=A0A8S5LRW5_9CAUD|nr:MAG TPA: hypothetical protein [Siphoviridae sp. ct7EW56]DAE38118.1 MAG TPA: hypothetical protein [Bacteriophage sp.]